MDAATTSITLKQFSVGWFDNDYIRDCEVAVVHNAQGNPVAFANIISEYQLNEATFDLMRHLSEIENGSMDFLFISMLEHFKQKGYDSFNLGLAALSGVGEGESSRMERGIHYLYEHLNQFYNFQGLRAYKDKFHPRWESRYIVYPQLAALPDVVVGLVRADSGDCEASRRHRLQDYLGSQFLSTAVAGFSKRLSRIAPILLSVLLFALSIESVACWILPIIVQQA